MVGRGGVDAPTAIQTLVAIRGGKLFGYNIHKWKAHVDSFFLPRKAQKIFLPFGNKERYRNTTYHHRATGVLEWGPRSFFS